MVYKTKIKEIRFKGIGPYYMPSIGVKEISDADCVIKISDDNVKEITEHKAGCDGDLTYYEVEYVNGELHRIYNPDYVIVERIEIKQDKTSTLPWD